MKRACAILFLLLFLTGCAQSPADAPPAEAIPCEAASFSGGGPLFLVASDLHYDPEVEENSIASLAIPQLSYNKTILKAMFAQMRAEKPLAVFLLGDLSDNGARQEHEGLIELLKRAEGEGLRIFVLPGNHDLGTSVGKEEFRKLYEEFGYCEANSLDPGSLSYAVDLEGFRILMLDVILLDSMEGLVSETSLQWIEALLKDAKEKGLIPISASHYGLFQHAISRYAKESALKGRNGLLDLAAAYSLPIHLSGHQHSRRILQMEWKGEELHELVVNMPANYPHEYGALEFSEDRGSLHYQARRIDVSAYSREQGLETAALWDFAAYSEELTIRQYRGCLENVLDAYPLKEVQKEAMKDLFVEAILASAEGNIASLLLDFQTREAYHLWQRYGSDSAYGMWLEHMLQGAENARREALITGYRKD